MCTVDKLYSVNLPDFDLPASVGATSDEITLIAIKQCMPRARL